MISGIHHFCRWEYSISWFACKNHQKHIDYQYIHQRRNHHWYHWSVGIFYLLVSCIYIYIYRFSAPSMDYWLLYPTKNELLTFQLVNLGDLLELHILSMKPQKNCFIKKWKNLLRFLSAWWVGDVEGMVLEEFQNIMLSVYIFVEFFFLNGFQKSTDRIFRLECQLCWLPVVTFYKYHILGKHWHKP